MRMLSITIIVFLYCSTAYSFESELVPIELTNILATKNDILLLHKEPSENSPIINNFHIKKGDSISFDKSRTRTLRSGKVLVKADEVGLAGNSYGNISYLSREKYKAPFLAARGKWFSLEGFEFKKGDIIEELHHAPEGSCIIRGKKQVMWIELCFWYGKNNDFQIIQRPEYEWWIRITSNNEPQGWLLIKDLSSIQIQ